MRCVMCECGREGREGYFTLLREGYLRQPACGVLYYVDGGGGRRRSKFQALSPRHRQTRSRTAVGVRCLVGEVVVSWNCSFKTTVILNFVGSETASSAKGYWSTMCSD